MRNDLLVCLFVACLVCGFARGEDEAKDSDPAYKVHKPYAHHHNYPLFSTSVGKWVEYGYWSRCTKTCYGGTQYRKRLCHYPPTGNPNVKKIPCRGISRVIRRCNTNKPCYNYGYWSNWGSWSRCSKTCYKGQHYRKKVCLYKPALGRTIKKPCSGGPHVQYEDCNVKTPCYNYGYWGSWGAWSQCSKTCYGGKQHRRRTCRFRVLPGLVVKVPCKGGSNLHYKDCNRNVICSNYGYWGSWGAWSKCSKTCHGGNQHRRRICQFRSVSGLFRNVPCKEGQHLDSKHCHDDTPCSNYGYWGSWGAWSKCSKTCYGGRQHRRRNCLFKSVSGPFRNVPCKEGQHLVSKHCNDDIYCSSYGYWSSWGAWSKCSKNCHKGYRERRRTCLYKHSRGIVRKIKCEGGDLHKDYCNLYKTCYLTGYWSSWGSWGSCSTTCNRGTRRRTRTCAFPKLFSGPFNRRVPCKGSSYVTGSCNERNLCGHGSCYDAAGTYKCKIKKSQGYCKHDYISKKYCRRTCGTCVYTPYKPYDSPS